MSQRSVVCSNLSFSWPDDTPVFAELSFTVPGGRTGLVAPNGAGKSTLLRLIAGELTASGGSVTVDGLVGYLPQTLPLAGDLAVAQVLGVAERIAALHAIGPAMPARTLRHDRRRLGHRGAHPRRTGPPRPRRPVARPSAGHPQRRQVVSLGLAAQLLRRPDVLLLDEPTNNLDLEARHKLYDVLTDWSGCLLLVSHDRELLDRMDRIAELDRGEMNWYGGNFTAYDGVGAGGAGGRREQPAQRRAGGQAGEAARCSRPANAPARRSSNALAEPAERRAGPDRGRRAEARAQESAGRTDGVNAARVGDAKARSMTPNARYATTTADRASTCPIPPSPPVARSSPAGEYGHASTTGNCSGDGDRRVHPRTGANRAHRRERRRQVDAAARDRR